MTRYWDAQDLLACLRGGIRSEVPQLEEEFARYVGARHAVGTSFGRTALYVGLRAAGVEGGEVLLPAFICTVVRNAVVAAGAAPRFVDVDPSTLEMDVDDLRRKIGPRSRAVVLVHYYGSAARNTREVAAEARRRGLIFVEDCAHSLGATLGGAKVGTIGDFAVFSLTKSTLNCGGGVMVTERDDLAAGARACREASRAGLRRRFVDFPLLAAYGIEQAVAKLGRDRPRPPGRLLPRLPDAVRRLRRALLGGGPRATALPAAPPTGPDTAAARGSRFGDLCLASVSAALGRAQLRKIDALTAQRRRIVRQYEAGRAGAAEAHVEAEGRACGFVALASRKLEARELVAAAAVRNVNLRATWPTRQRLWDGQETGAVKRLAREVVTWTVNPDLGEGEVAHIRSVTEGLGAVALCPGARP